MPTPTPLRILVVLPMYGGSLPVGRACVRGLESLGHLVEGFEAPAFHGAYQSLEDLRVAGDRLEYLQNSFLNVVSQAVLAKVEAFAPDLVLALAQAPLSRQALARLRRDGVATAMWFVEDFRLFTYWQAFAPHYDLFAVIQREPFLAELATVGQANGFYLPLAADPELQQPLELAPAERKLYGARVAFMGAGYPNRRLAFRRLAGEGFKIWGSDWDGDAQLASFVQLDGRRVSSEECVKIFNASQINLNLHSSVQTRELVSGGDFVNPRTFEIAACGAFQLVDKRTMLDELFAPDELARFGSLDELEELIAHWSAHPEERAAMARRARARVLAEHTYAHRMQTLLDEAAARLPNWPPQRTQDAEALAVLPEKLREPTAQLLASLGLPPRVEFADLVAAVRARQGVLSELETSILFLDEWRKQYGGA